MIEPEHRPAYYSAAEPGGVRDWWTLRRAQSRKPASYRCPFCGYQLHAMSPHVLIAPEGDTARRRHAHAECAAAAREAGRLPCFRHVAATRKASPEASA